MKWKFWEKEQRGLEQGTLSSPPQWLIDYFGGSGLAAGVTVNETTAMQLSTVYDCTKVLAESVGSLPLQLYKARQGRGSDKATDHPVYNLLHRAPNPEMTAVEFIECMQLHLTLRGNAYAEIVTNGAGAVRELWPLNPDKMAVKRIAGQLTYFYTLPTGAEVTLPATRVLHLRAFGSNGVVGLSPIQQAREAVGGAIAAEKFGNALYANGARPSGVVTLDGKAKDETIDRLRNQFQAAYGGIDNAARIMILENGLKFDAISISPKDAEFLAVRKYQRSEIAALFRVPPHMIGDLEKATFSNIEQQSIDFVKFTLLPWLTKWEQRLNMALLTESEMKAGYFFKFNTSGLLRGDTKDRFAAYAVGRQNGWLSANDIREMEDLNPIDDGDIYLVPLNMVPADQAGQTLPIDQNPDQSQNNQPGGVGDVKTRGGCTCGHEHADHDSKEERADDDPDAGYFEKLKVAESFQPVFEAAAERILRRETDKIMQAVNKFFGTRDATEDFTNWMETFYRDEFPGYVSQQVKPAYVSLCRATDAAINAELPAGVDLAIDQQAFAQEFADRYARDYGMSSQEMILWVMQNQGDDLVTAEAIKKRLDEWMKTRAMSMAESEPDRITNEYAKRKYEKAGYKAFRWATRPGCCAY